MSNPNATITAIPAFSDNYIWAITATAENDNNKHLALVDPGCADVCIAYIEQHKLALNYILITHHHADHIGGLAKLKQYCADKSWPLTIYYPKHQAITDANNGITQSDCCISEGDNISLELLGLELKVIEVPGHTLSHVAYYNLHMLFCGDTLFSGGCGRLFEGTAEQMLHSLNKFSELPDNTLVYCAHEYTQANLNFALTVDPTNADLVEYYNQVNQLRENNTATIPTTIAREKAINPFLRSHLATLKVSAEEASNKPVNHSVDVFRVIRQLKDEF